MELGPDSAREALGRDPRSAPAAQQMDYAEQARAFFAQPPAACSNCEGQASLLCVTCELVYCAACFRRRHRKGSFARHDKVLGLRTCRECEQAVAVVECAACDMDFCRECTKQMHSMGAMRTHKAEGAIRNLICLPRPSAPAAPPRPAPPRPAPPRPAPSPVRTGSPAFPPSYPHENLSIPFLQPGSELDTAMLDQASRPISQAFDAALSLHSESVGALADDTGSVTSSAGRHNPLTSPHQAERSSSK